MNQRSIFSLLVVVFFVLPMAGHAQTSVGIMAEEGPRPGSPEGDRAIRNAQEDLDAQANPNAADPTANNADAIDRYANAAAMKKAALGCEDADKVTAAKACGDPKSDKGMSSQDKTMLMMGLAQVASVGAQIAAAKGSAMACMLGQGLSTTLQTLTLIKANACSKSRNACLDTCGAVAEKIDRSRDWAVAQLAKTPNDPVAIGLRDQAPTSQEVIRKPTSNCKGYEQNQMMMAMQMQQLMNGAGQMANCAAQSSDANSETGLVATAPTPVQLSLSAGSCSDPAFAASSPGCICIMNPRDPSCALGSASGVSGTGGLATGGVGSPGIGDASGDGEGSVVDTTAVPGKGQNGTVAGGGSGGGGGPSGGGGGGLNPDGSGGGDGTSGINKDVITGQSGSGNGGLSAGGGGAGGGGLGRPGGGSGSGGGSGFNLSKYLPKNLFKNRGLAGMTVPAQDGVTGPLGPTIWEKVHTRYEDKKSTLILDK